MNEKMNYIFTITYNFDSAYVAKKCKTYEEAVEMLNDYLTAEAETVKQECQYEPSIIRYSKDEATLVYAEGYHLDDMTSNMALEQCAYYRIFAVEDTILDKENRI